MSETPYCQKCDIYYSSEVEKTNVVKFSGGELESAQIVYTICPKCQIISMKLVGKVKDYNSYRFLFETNKSDVSNVSEAPDDVPINIASDYNEAAAVLSISPKASAALSRRCLQNILIEKGYKHHNLFSQIEAVLAEEDATKAIPETLRMTLDAIRNFGNFSAHPITDLTTSQIIDVDENEAEWCLEILDEAFECFYVRPKRIEERREELNKKLEDAGKPEAQ